MTWLVDGRALARKVKNSPDIAKSHSRIECHQCGFIIDQSNGIKEWPGLPAGVKFDPSDLEILEHLAAKLGHGNAKPHPFIDEFVPTIPGEGGICYTHPENLPGVRRDGSSAHFFHAPAKSYSTGNRKRRKVLSEDEERGHHHIETRWHKTGKTKIIVENGIKLGCKKIMVLYATNNKVKPEKTNWVMHQYHLGDEEDESEGDMLVSKVFYQTQSRVIRKDDECSDLTNNMGLPCEYTLQSNVNTASRSVSLQGIPLTPKISAPSRPPIGKKHHKGLLETISEDVNRLNLSLNASAIDSWSSQENNEDYLCHNIGNGIDVDKFNGLFEDYSENQLKRKQSINEVVDSIVLEARFNSEEAVKEMDSIVKCFTKIDSKNRVPVPRTTTKPQSHTRLTSILNLTLDDVPDEDESKCDNGLSNIILDTPPELLLDSLVGSQDTLDWLGKRKFGSESQSQTGSIQQGGDYFNAMDFLQNSQSSS